MPNGERNLKLTIEYDGTDYSGWQVQANAMTVQQVIEQAVQEMTGVFCRLHGSGRTDAGVHARAQVANFRTTSTIPADGFVRGLNGLLPDDIAVLSACAMPDDFDARRSARGKHYSYHIWNGATRSPIVRHTAWSLYQPIDTNAMAGAAKHLLGEHDFSAFRAADCQRDNPVRIVRRLDVTRTNDNVCIDLEATAFLKNMARIIVGTLVDVGLGSRAASELGTIIEGRDRKYAGRTAPAHGLMLEKVFYETEPSTAK